MSKESDRAHLKVLKALATDNASGVFDRYRRLIVAGEPVSRAGSTVPLTCFIEGWIEMGRLPGTERRVYLTHNGAQRFKSLEFRNAK